MQITVTVIAKPKYIMNEPTQDQVDTMNAIFPGMGDQFRVIWQTQQQLSKNASMTVISQVQEACVGLAEVFMTNLCHRSFGNMKLVTHETEGSSGNEQSTEHAPSRKKTPKKEDVPVKIPKTVRDFLKGEYPDLINEKLNVFCSVLDPCNLSIRDCELNDVFSDLATVWNVLLGCVHESNAEKVYELFIPEPKRSVERAIMFDQFHKNVNETLKTKKKESEKGSIRNVAQDKMCLLYPELYKVHTTASRVLAEEDDDEDFAPNQEDDSALLDGHDEAFEFEEVPKGTVSPARQTGADGLIALKRQLVFFH